MREPESWRLSELSTGRSNALLTRRCCLRLTACADFIGRAVRPRPSALAQRVDRGWSFVCTEARRPVGSWYLPLLSFVALVGKHANCDGGAGLIARLLFLILQGSRFVDAPAAFQRPIHGVTKNPKGVSSHSNSGRGKPAQRLHANDSAHNQLV